MAGEFGGVWVGPAVADAIMASVESRLRAIEADARRDLDARVPRDTGRLASTCQAHVVRVGDQVVLAISAGGEADDGVLVDYAGFVELGTSRSPAQPFLRPAGDAAADALGRALKGGR